ncbi:hypothetical protein STEG23_022221 [Scotinomys teguina]
MNSSSKVCRKTSFPRGNIFCNLIDKIVKRPSLQFLGQWGYHCYEPRIYRTLAKILRYVDLDGFDILLTDYIAFVEKSGHRFELNLNLEFTEICVNTILYWVFARKGNPDFVELLLKKTKAYVPDRSCSLALIWSYLRSIHPTTHDLSKMTMKSSYNLHRHYHTYLKLQQHVNHGVYVEVRGQLVVRVGSKCLYLMSCLAGSLGIHKGDTSVVCLVPAESFVRPVQALWQDGTQLSTSPSQGNAFGFAVIQTYEIKP